MVLKDVEWFSTKLDFHQTFVRQNCKMVKLNLSNGGLPFSESITFGKNFCTRRGRVGGGGEGTWLLSSWSYRSCFMLFIPLFSPVHATSKCNICDQSFHIYICYHSFVFILTVSSKIVAIFKMKLKTFLFCDHFKPLVYILVSHIDYF